MAIINRTGAGALVPEDVSRSIIQGAVAESVALQRFRRVPMSRKQQRMPVLAALPTASFLTAVSGDTDIGFKPLTIAQWANKYLNAEPVGAVVVIPEDVLDDSDFNMWEEIRPRASEAIGKALDAAVFFGAGAPTSWTDAIVPDATTAGQTVNFPLGVDLAADINTAMGMVEQYGYEITGHAAAPTTKSALRGLRDDNHQPIYVSDLRSDGGQNFSVYGYPTSFFKNGAWDPAAAKWITGDFEQGLLGVRQDITVKLLDEATLYGSGLNDPQIALAQQDSVALRFVARFAFVVSNPITALKGPGWSPTGGGTDTYPFAVVTP